VTDEFDELNKVGPLDHIVRAVLPWRDTADLTECGRPVADVAGRLISRDEAKSRVKNLGRVRAAFTLCITCASTSDRYNRFEIVDAAAALARHLHGVQYAHEPRGGEPSALWLERQRINAELEAIRALIDAHREEWDGYLADRAETVSLDARRARRRTRRPNSGTHGRRL
jgi:hypothetical protein